MRLTTSEIANGGSFMRLLTAPVCNLRRRTSHLMSIQTDAAFVRYHHPLFLCQVLLPSQYSLCDDERLSDH
jgi:hypothetical protein